MLNTHMRLKFLVALPFVVLFLSHLMCCQLGKLKDELPRAS